MRENLRVAGIVANRRPVEAAQRASAKIIVLPGAFHPKHYVAEIVRLMLSVDRAKGEYHLGREMQILEEDLVGAGAEPGAVDRALRSLEAAVRAALWDEVLGNG